MAKQKVLLLGEIEQYVQTPPTKAYKLSNIELPTVRTIHGLKSLLSLR